MMALTPDPSPVAGAARVQAALEAMARGEILVVIDAPGRENEGDLVIAAEHVTPEAINFMATCGRGLICTPMLPARLAQLGVPPMVGDNTDPHGTAFHISVDYSPTSTTGISASDRANTIRALIDESADPADFSRPGHVFPLAYRAGGVLRRAGHTEASIDLAVLAGLSPAAVICEVAQADGEMARLPQLVELAEAHDLRVVFISDLIAYRRQREKLVQRVSQARVPLRHGGFTAIGYRDLLDGHEHIAFTMGDVARHRGVLVRMHSECLTGDVFGSRRCDCGEQLELALATIAKEGCGVVVYLRGHEGRGIGLLDKLHAYRLQDEGQDTVEANLALGHPADRRDYGIGMQILHDLNVREMRLLTNNPAKRAGLEGYGLKVLERVPLVTPWNPENLRYLQTKAQKLGHALPRPSVAQ
jgi:3,4-dihydroxy 2-butanone 4-phosphate synthase/GTP cyclohydrolase II